MIKTVLKSSNKKLGKGVSSTYREVGPTCPSSCKHYQSKSCYALWGHVGIHQKNSSRSDDDAESAYKFVKSLPENQSVRHHVSGDFMFMDSPDEKYIEGVLRAHSERPDVRGWTYTHGWRQLSQEKMNSKNSLTVNASCDSVDDLVDAVNAGWPATITVAEDQENFEIGQTKVVICPQQRSESVTCEACGLCMNKGRKSVVGFRLHGTGKNKWS